ncbi:MAG TPA: glycerophosphodiester phosphodiesterase family protein [Hyphomicrobiaceae bacterium]|jgi:glycerophosphoryl diester phosphodiesterase|nr:glycerophosphodiester phosphodiesterase family protein [Hyphomicrobiaceae bacterium]
MIKNSSTFPKGRAWPRGPASPLDRVAFVRPIAHRGLHDATAGRIENTAPAFQAAIDKGYGIECDLQAASGGTPMVFHDETLDRLVDASGPVASRTPAELARLRYKGQDTRLSTFADLLDQTGGRVPILVEVKSPGPEPPSGFLDQIARQARAYRGPLALMSFDRKLVAALGELAPKVPRGLVVGSEQLRVREAAGERDVTSSPAVARLLKTAPDGVAFFAVDVRLLPGAAACLMRNRLDFVLYTWTVRTLKQRAAAERWADAPIFEGYEP